MSHFHVILQEIFHNLSISQSFNSQFLRFSVSQILFWAFRRSRRAFRYIFARFLPLSSPILLLHISRCTTFTYFLYETTLQ